MSGEPDSWEYSDHVNADDVAAFCRQIVAKASNDPSVVSSILVDTRPSHKEMFSTVTPVGHEYFAGNYRGSAWPKLQFYNVALSVGGKEYYGHPSALVERAMASFHAELGKSIDLFKRRSAELQWDKRKKVAGIAKLVGSFFVRFLTINPYANGNGHISRLIVWCMFAITSVNSSFWQVPDRNLEPPDIQVAQYRDGYTEPLLRTFIMLIDRANVSIH